MNKSLKFVNFYTDNLLILFKKAFKNFYIL